MQTKTTFYQCRRLSQQQLGETQDAWLSLSAKKIQDYADCNETNNTFAEIKATYAFPQRKEPHYFSAPMDQRFRRKSQTIRAVEQLSSGKAPGSGAILAEIYKHSGHRLIDHLTALFQKMWRCGKFFRISRTQQ
ncbi:hypothetical protein SprV_0100352400 [Sparganum proliferum]